MSDVKGGAPTPIVLAFTPDYFVPAATLLCSILRHSPASTHFEVICLLTEALPVQMQQELALLNGERLRFRFINLQGELQDIYVDPKYTVAAAYRLLLPELLSEYDKVLYVDCDMVVQNDIAALFRKVDMGDHYLAGVAEATLEFQLPHMEAIGCKPGTYINSGFLIMNLEQLRRDKMVEKFMAAASAAFLLFPDQDVLNQSCKGRILYLAPYHNAIRTFYLPQYKQAFLNYYTEQDWQVVQQRGNIHYTGGKPWKTFTVRFEDWWKYHAQLPHAIRNRQLASPGVQILQRICRTRSGRSMIKVSQRLYRKLKSV
jgi:UDP-glucose:(galactosyl)LPS alpha-1,2-glucosyltransferase